MPQYTVEIDLQAISELVALRNSPPAGVRTSQVEREFQALVKDLDLDPELKGGSLSLNAHRPPIALRFRDRPPVRILYKVDNGSLKVTIVRVEATAPPAGSLPTGPVP